MPEVYSFTRTACETSGKRGTGETGETCETVLFLPLLRGGKVGSR
jgi:hypothetical protein